MHATSSGRFCGSVAAAMAVLLSAVPAGPAFAERNDPAAALGDPAIAETAHVCSACHGIEGRSVSPLFPHLAGQQKDYLALELKEFRDHSRGERPAHTFMWGMASRLTDAAIDRLAAWYATLPPVDGREDDREAIEQGRKIFTEGVAATNVPPCGSCHGEKAEGAGEVPRLAGQHRSYLESQLDVFASGERGDNDVMHENAKGLTKDQIAAVAAFLAAM